MKYAVKALSNGRARAGVLQLGSSCGCPLEIETPSLLLPTRKGLPLFISPDLLPSLPSPDSRLLQLSPLHFLEGLPTQTIKNLGGLHQMLGLHEYGLVAVPRDSIQCLPASEATNKVGASFETPCGRCLIKPKEYMEMISSMRPDIWVTLADEVPTWVSEKRNSSSVGRTIRWLDECIALRPVQLSLGQNKQFEATRAALGKQPFVLGSSVDICLGGDIFGSIVGGANVQQRQQCAEEVAKRNVSGYWIGGFGLGESMDERPALLKAVCDNLPEEKPRLVCGLGLPEEVLQGVAAGIDLYDTTYIYHITIGGFALTFPLDKIGASELIPYSSNIGSDQTKINLRATVYRKDATPIVQRCSCYTCKNHTKAYINHLLNVHEMLAQTLLEIHNTHHFLGFFRLIREAIKEGEFEQFREKFIHDRREHLAVSAVHA